MFCSNCGKQIPDGEKLCVHCGTATPADFEDDVKQPAPNATEEAESEAATEVTPDTAEEVAPAATPEPLPEAAPAVTEEASSEPESAPEAPPKKKKISGAKLATVIVASVLALALIWIGAFHIIKYLLSLEPTPAAPTEAYVVDGKAYIPYGSGELYTVNGDVKQAFLTPTGKRIIVLYEDGELWAFPTGNLKKGAEVYAAQEGEEIALDAGYITDEAFIYMVKDKIYRYHFENKDSDVIVGPDTSVVASTNCADNPHYLSIAYASGGSIYVLGREDKDARKVASCSSKFPISSIAVSVDAKTVSWTESNTDTGIDTAYIWQDGVKSLLGTIEYLATPYTELHSGKISDGFAVICTAFGKTVFFKKTGENAMRVDLPFKIAPNGTYRVDGTRINDHVSADITGGMLVITYNESKPESPYILYYISESGKYEYLTGACRRIVVCGEKVLYENASGALYAATFDVEDTDLKNVKKIDEGIDPACLRGSRSADFLFYTKTDVTISTLYAYDVKSGTVETVSSDVLVSDDPNDLRIKVSFDGSRVYYFKDAEYQAGRGEATGTLYVYDASTKKSTKIDENVVTWSLKSAVPHGEINPDSLIYEVYLKSNDKATAYYADIIHFDDAIKSTVVSKVEIKLPARK